MNERRERRDIGVFPHLQTDVLFSKAEGIIQPRRGGRCLSYQSSQDSFVAFLGYYVVWWIRIIILCDAACYLSTVRRWALLIYSAYQMINCKAGHTHCRDLKDRIGLSFWGYIRGASITSLLVFPIITTPFVKTPKLNHYYLSSPISQSLSHSSWRPPLSPSLSLSSLA